MDREVFWSKEMEQKLDTNFHGQARTNLCSGCVALHSSFSHEIKRQGQIGTILWQFALFLYFKMSSNGGKTRSYKKLSSASPSYGLYLNWPFVFLVNNLNQFFVSYSILTAQTKFIQAHTSAWKKYPTLAYLSGL